MCRLGARSLCTFVPSRDTGGGVRALAEQTAPCLLTTIHMGMPRDSASSPPRSILCPASNAFRKSCRRGPWCWTLCPRPRCHVCVSSSAAGTSFSSFASVAIVALVFDVRFELCGSACPPSSGISPGGAHPSGKSKWMRPERRSTPFRKVVATSLLFTCRASQAPFPRRPHHLSHYRR